MADSAALDELELEATKVLMQEYLSARQEVLLHLQLYKTVPTRNAVILTAVVGLLIPLLTGQTISLPGGLVLQLTTWSDLVILFTLSTISFLLIFSVIAILFNIQVLAERCFRLEEQINESLRGRYLFWEHFAHQIWSTDSVLVYKMPDALAAIFFHVLVLIFSVGLPLFVLVKIRCGAPDVWITSTMFFYVIYMFAFSAISFYVNKETMGSLRPYCRKLLQQTLAGDDPPRGRSGLRTLLMIGGAAGAVACVLLVIIPQPKVCAYIGVKSASVRLHLAMSSPSPQPGTGVREPRASMYGS